MGLSMETSPFLLLFLLGYCLAVIEGELRCYCNESGCVSTAYMCKSSAGQCFTALEVRGEVTHQTHGCLDSLPEELRTSCQDGAHPTRPDSAGRVGNAARHSPRGRGSPVLLCCKEHMCNYRENLDVNVVLTPKYNGTFHRGPGPSDIYSRAPHSDRDEERDLWFKAAVIAVPIAGGFILVLLVLLAVRMLKADSRRHRRLVQYRRERSLTKAHMYITDHFVSKASKQHCSVYNEKTITTHPSLYSPANQSVAHSHPDTYHVENTCRHSSAHCESSNLVQPFSSSSNEAPHTTSANTASHTNSHTHHHHHRQHMTSPSTQPPSHHPCTGSDSECTVTSCSTPKLRAKDNGVVPAPSPGTMPQSGEVPDPDNIPAHRAPAVSTNGVCGTRDMCVKLDRSGQPVPQIHRTGRKGAGRGDGTTSLTTWDKSCATPPPAKV